MTPIWQTSTNPIANPCGVGVGVEFGELPPWGNESNVGFRAPAGTDSILRVRVRGHSPKGLPRVEAQRLRVLRRLNEHKEGLSLDELADLATVGELRSIHEAGLITKTSDNKRLLINDRGRKLLTPSRRS